MHKKIYRLALLLSLSSLVLWGNGHVTPAEASKEEIKQGMMEKVFKIQIPFILNKGQIHDENVRFYARTFGGNFYVTKTGEMVYSFQKFGRKAKRVLRDKPSRSETTKGWVLKESLLGAISSEPQGIEKAKTKINNFIGNEKKGWKMDIPTYNAINLGEVYKGVYLSLRAYGGNVEKVFTARPGADVNKIKLKIEGANSLRVSEGGTLDMETGLGRVRFTEPIAYQERNGHREYVQIAYHVEEDTYGFVVGSYDKSSPLVIDPLLASTFICGSWGITDVSSLALDGSGNVYVAGYTNHPSFPTTPGAYDRTYNGDDNVFTDDSDVIVSKFNPNLSALLASTFIGGSGEEEATSLAIDSSGNIYIAGGTGSADFPTTSGAYNRTSQGVFVTKLDPNLRSLLASAFIGSGDAYSLAIDRSGNVYVAGGTNSANFPTTPGAYDRTCHGYGDVFVSKLDSNLTTLLASTFIGGDRNERANALAIDNLGNVYVAGYTDSTDYANYPTPYPTTPGAYDTTYNGYGDVFVSKFDCNLTTLLASTFIGGNGVDEAYALAIDSSDNVYVAGGTRSSDFPTTPGAYDRTYNGGCDAFISKLNSNLSTLLASTFIGGGVGDNPWDEASSVAIDRSGNIYAAGTTDSAGFPTTPGAYDRTCDGGDCYWGDGFVSRLDSNLSTLLASTFIGGEEGGEYVVSIAIDNSGNIYIAGGTFSDDFPTTPGAYKRTNPGGSAFVSKLSGDLSATGANPTYTGSTNPSGLQIAVDSATYSAPHTFNWIPGSSYTLSVSSPQSGPTGTRYVYSSWSDGGAQTHTITAPSSSITYTANFGTQYSLITSVNAAGAGIVNPSGTNWYDNGESVSVSATAKSGYSFNGWSGDLSGTTNPTSIIMNGPKTVTANFTSTNVPDISVTPLSYDFGNVEVKKSKTASFKVKNNGKADLLISPSITGTDVSLFTITSGGGSKTIKPNKTLTIKVVFKPTSAGPKSSTLGITSNDPDTPTIEIPLTGTAPFSAKTPDISVAQTSIEFGGIKVGKKTTKTLKITNNGTGDLVITLSGLEETDFSIQGSSSVTIKTKKSYSLKVLFTPTSGGLKTAILRITSNDPDTPILDIPSSGTGQ